MEPWPGGSGLRALIAGAPGRLRSSRDLCVPSEAEVLTLISEAPKRPESGKVIGINLWPPFPSPASPGSSLLPPPASFWSLAVTDRKQHNWLKQLPLYLTTHR